MEAFLVLLSLSVLLLFILTRDVWLTFCNNDGIEIAIHFPIFALYLTKSKKGDAKRGKKKKRSPSYKRIISAIIHLSEKSKLTVNKIDIPVSSKNFDGVSIAKSYGQYSFIFPIIAYVGQKSKDFTLRESSVHTDESGKSLTVDITFRSELYNFILAYFSFKKEH